VAEAAVVTARLQIAWRALGLAFAGVLAVALLGYWAIALRGIESTDDAFVEGHMVFLSPRVGGQVAEVLVEENQQVRSGDALVRLDSADFDARVARARADLDAAHNRMEQSRAAADAAAAQIRVAQVKLHHAEQEVARAQSLFDEGVGSQTVLDAALAERDAALAEQHAAEERERAERALVGSAAPVRQAEAALREAELALEHAVVKAPFAGIIGRRSVELGANVAPGQPLVALAETGGSWVTANFKETQIAQMNPGDPAEVRVDAFPGAVFRGRVESLSPATGAKYALLPPDNATGNFTKVVQRVPVRIALDAVEGDAPALLRGEDGKPWLPVGLSVDVRVRVR
jgi:membrane fusion protein (multidrug efflux system)